MSILDRSLDTRPLRSNPHFRRLWIGISLQTLGRQITVVAVLYQVWEMTQSSLWVGIVGLVYALPIIIFGLIGGSLADSMDRRVLVLWTTIGALVAALLLALQALLSAGSLPILLLLLFAQSAFTSLGSPARRTFVPRLLPTEQVGAGIALIHVSFQLSMLIGPAIAGLSIAWLGVEACYALEAVAFCAAIYGVASLPSMCPLGEAGKAGVTGLKNGLRLIVRRPELSGSFLSDLAAMLLAMPVALFPAMNEQRFDGSPQTLGLFLSAIAAGGIVASASSGMINRIAHAGRVQLVAAALWGAALAAAALVNGLWATLLFLALAGAADTISVISRGTILQVATPDAYRGRVSSVEGIVGVGGPELGNLRAGISATLLSPQLTMATGGLACVLSIGIIALTNPALRRFTMKDHSQEE
ncbi:MFS transporter [Arthrobacter tecti]